MAFYAGKVIRHPKMQNPTLVVITDRNDLDDQLFGTFANCHELLRQKPTQADDRDAVKGLLQVASGGVVFTTLQKFAPDPDQTYPRLSDRRNVVVIADEAHRSQYGHFAKAKTTGEISYGFSKHLRDALPHASYLGFTGTPIELGDKNTKAVFGDYIDIYDISRAVEDGATVKIYYEGRLAKLQLSEKERPKIDQDFEEVTEGEEQTSKEKLKTKWAALEALVGSEKRIRLIAQDIVKHWDERLATMDGKGMIVCMSRRICVELYKELVKRRPEWHSDHDEDGALKVVMTGQASDPTDWQQHIRSKRAREEMAKRFKKPDDPLKLVIVRDMWLTGFDAPCLHTMYVDKPMSGHNLMQAIARVNRVFQNKPGGLIVDYLGLAAELKKALAQYTKADREETGIPIDQALEVLFEKYEVVQAFLHGFDYSQFFTGTASQRVGVIPAALDFILQQQDGQSRFVQAVTELSKAFALVATHDSAVRLREEVAFFQCLRAQFVKLGAGGDGGGPTKEDLDAAVRQIISRSVASDEVIDIFAAAGMERPDISILSDEFLAEVRDLPQRNLALEVLRRLLSDEIKARSRTNLVKSRSFAEMLEKSIKKYQNRSIDAAQVIAELVEIARQMREARQRGENLGLSEDEEAFYEALEVNDSAVAVLGDKALCAIARELVNTVRGNVAIDWTVKESVRAKLRVLVKKILKKHGYPPDKQAQATETVLKQAELLCADWAVESPRPVPAVAPAPSHEFSTAHSPAPARTPTAHAERVPPGRLVEPRPQDRFKTCVPLIPMRAAAGGFGEAAGDLLEGAKWLEITSRRRLRPGMFVAQVVGHSMEPLIPDGTYCLFQSEVAGSREGKIVLVRLRDGVDPDTGERFTVKRYSSEKQAVDDGEWRHSRVTLSPINPAFAPIVLEHNVDDRLEVVAEFLEVMIL